MRKKLIELLKEAQHCWQLDYDYDIWEEHIADHLLASGQVIVLPCKVGDTVWVINRHLNTVFENTVISISVGRSSDLKNYIKTRWVGKMGNEVIRKWTLRQVGRYVFLTREEAEAALKEERT